MNKTFLNNKYIRLLAISLVILIAVSFIQDFGTFLDEHSDNVVKLGNNSLCDPMRSVCSASIINNGEFQRLSLSIKALNAEKNQYQLFVNASGFDFEGIESLAVFLKEQEGEDVQTILLSPEKSNQLVVAEKWTETVKIEAKNRKNSQWLATIRLKSTKKEYHAEFSFQINSP